MAITRLEIQAEQLLNKGVAQSTSRVYASAQQIFLEFCHCLSLMPLPVSESTLIYLFVTELAQTRAHSTIRTYLRSPAPPCSAQARQPPTWYSEVRAGTQRHSSCTAEEEGGSSTSYSSHLGQDQAEDPGFESTMLWAACCMGFFGFLRCGEFMLQDAARFDATVHLTAPDIAVDNPTNPSLLAITIKKSKTDQFCNGTTIYFSEHLSGDSSVAIFGGPTTRSRAPLHHQHQKANDKTAIYSQDSTGSRKVWHRSFWIQRALFQNWSCNDSNCMWPWGRAH